MITKIEPNVSRISELEVLDKKSQQRKGTLPLKGEILLCILQLANIPDVVVRNRK